MSFFTPQNDVISYKLDVTLRSAHDATEVLHSHPTQENSHCHKGGPITSSTLNPRPHTHFKKDKQPKHTSMKRENKLKQH